MSWLRDRVYAWLGVDAQLRRNSRALLMEVDRRLQTNLLPENFNMRLHGAEASLRLIEKRLEALELLSGPDGFNSVGLAGKKTADLLEAAAALRRDKSAAAARGQDLETYLEERKRRPAPPSPPIFDGERP